MNPRDALKRLWEFWTELGREEKIAVVGVLANLVIVPTALGVTLSGGTDSSNDNNAYIYDAGNTTSDNSTTTSFEYETGAFGKLLNHFYDEECLVAQDPELYKRTAKMFRVFVEDLRAENQLITMASLAGAFCLAQLGGLPTPMLGSPVALSIWSSWMLAVAVQWFSTQLSLIMTCESYTVFAKETRECMVPFVEGSEYAR